MRIGIDIRPLMTAPRTGVGEYTFELLNAIFKIDRVNQYFLFYNSSRNVSANIPDWKYENVKIIGWHVPNKFFNTSVGLFGQPKLDRMCGCKRLDYWFAPNLNFTALSPKIKSILTVHDLSFDFFPEFCSHKHFWCHKAMQPEKQCHRADIIITPSANTKRDIVNYYDVAPEKIKVIYPGIKQTTENHTGHPELVSGSIGIPQKMLKQIQHDVKQKYHLPEKFILFLGTIEPRKNIIGLIEAFEKYCSLLGKQPPNCHSEHPLREHKLREESLKDGGKGSFTSLCSVQDDIGLIIAGAPGWKNEKIFNRAKNSKFADQIKFIGFVSPEDKPALYGAAEIFVYPSLYEGFGFPVLEAMSAGTPVITSNRSSLPEIAGSAAYLIDPTRPEQLALAINELLTKPALREWHIQKGHEQAAKFTWQKAAEEWLDATTRLMTQIT